MALLDKVGHVVVVIIVIVTLAFLKVALGVAA